MLVKQSSSFSRAQDFICPDMAAKQFGPINPVDYGVWGLVQLCTRHRPRQRLEASSASWTHLTTSSTKLLEKAVTRKREARIYFYLLN